MTVSTTSSSPVWEKFAQDDPYWYIDMAHDGNMERFWREGRRSAEQLLKRARLHLAGQDTVIDIGCGVGRLLIPMAGHFRRAIGVDVAPTMLDRMEQHAGERGIAVKGYRSDESWHEHPADFVYSKIVFRHIDEWAVIEDYLQKTAAALKPDGVAVLDFDTRPQTLPYHLRNWTPDTVLPRAWRANARGTRRPSNLIRRTFFDAGLAIVEERNPDSGAHEFILVPSRAS